MLLGNKDGTLEVCYVMLSFQIVGDTGLASIKRVPGITCISDMFWASSFLPSSYWFPNDLIRVQHGIV